MERPLTYLKQRNGDDWLIGRDSHKFSAIAEQLFQELTQRNLGGTPPKILLAERDPVKFLAGFIAACAAGCPVFLCNPNWVQQEWQQVFKLVQPDLILGYGDWELTVRDYYPSPQPAILNPKWIMIPTGGSSGQIRFAIHTWETLIASVRGFVGAGLVPALKSVNSFCVLPLYHVSGLMQFLRSFTTGGQLAILPFKELEAGVGYAPTPNPKATPPNRPEFQGGQNLKSVDPANFFISLVPTQLQRLLQKPDTADWLSRFHTVLIGGAPTWPELLEQARHKGIRLAPTYGMTETASQIVTLKPEDFLSGNFSCGQVLPHANVTIRNSTGHLLSANQTGIITIQAESLALGYYPKLFTQNELQLDDLGFFDRRGYLHIVGRSSNKIITGGENVFPSEVESAIRATQMIADVCVIGIPDKHWGQAVTAIYVPTQPAISITALQATLEKKISKFKQPKHWILVENLPRNPQGKVNREQLHQIATAALSNSKFKIKAEPTTQT